ncbi:Type II secretion system protein G precursor [Planctomycetes bacterium CA13]|uniref:Type II secretion system protein G n=1 Tax=Novipirellula herctigrandis TaxID=2527986 RepID=A0A5C5Z4R5_9BACT|nr:Type II secretion system protein G precursor [Planctomycetes bacterium CA13]
MRTEKRKTGFTLVEILVVIVIIGILAGLAIPAVTGALRTAKEAAIRQEIDVLSQSLEAYRLDRGSYPPDFSDWNAVERHFRKAFPNMNDNELRILSQFTHYNSGLAQTDVGAVTDPRTSAAFGHYPHAIDRAEALVFCLGGFSSDKKRPFTGQGGPLVLASGSTDPYTAGASSSDFLKYQYNTDRNQGQFPFKTQDLTIALLTSPTAYAYSNDEGAGGAGGSSTANSLGATVYADPFPVFRPNSTEMPIAYFNSSTYNITYGTDPSGSSAPAWLTTARYLQSLNVYCPPGDLADVGIARPYASNVIDTTPPSTIRGFSVTLAVAEFAENKRFQLISAGLDNNYGGLVSVSGSSLPSSGCLYIYSVGRAYNPFATTTQATTMESLQRYQDNETAKAFGGSEVYISNPQLDNVTNFSTRTLESDLE